MPSTLPPPPPPPYNVDQSHHHVDTLDVPAVPSTSQRSQPYATNQYEEIGNPWEDSTYQADKRQEIPDLLKPGIIKAPTQPTSNANIPDVLRPGWSGEATPRSSLDSDRDRSPEREWWDDDDPVEQEKDKQNELDTSGRLPTELHVVNHTPSPAAALQPLSTVKRKPVAQGLTPPRQPSPSTSPDKHVDLGSNNPFRRPSDTQAMENAWASTSRPAEQHPHPLRSSPSTDQMGRLALNDPMSEKEAWSNAPSAPPPPPPAQAPPPIPKLQEPLQPQQTGGNPWASQPASAPRPPPSPSSFESSKQYNTIPTDDLLDRGHHEGSVSLGSELKAIPNNSTAPGPSTSEVSLLEDDNPAPPRPPHPTRQESEEMYAPPPGPPPSHQSQLPPVKPPRPAVVTSEADLAKLREQRNETYQIKHFNWYDMRTSRMRRSSMLTQNKNGPCPLLALVNALILGATEDMQASLDEALRLREQVTLGLIVETLMDELITRASTMYDLQLPEIDELNRFLMRLRTGMNANPRFVPPSQPTPNLMDADTPTAPTAHQQNTPAGTFERTEDIKLYGSFQVKLVHGWLPQPNDAAAKAFARTAQTYEDAQAVQFGEEELEYKLSTGGLNVQEQQVWEDISSIKQFFQAYPTQLTPYGLSAVQNTLQGGEFAIMFRNDHFSTIYKHPRDQRLYTLITDAGYADRDEIIWESLEDITGARSDFFSGDFNSVSHGDSHHAIPHSMTDAANPQRRRSGNLAAPREEYEAMTPQEQQEQADLDFALALQMQEEEEQAQRRARNEQQAAQRQSENPSQQSAFPGRAQGRRTAQGIPIPLRSNPGGEQRPIIPPRNQNTNRTQAVNRPADADQADAPPAYEEAARQTAYVPPIGSPLHPSSSTDLPLGRATSSTSNIHAQGQTTGVTGGNSPFSQPQRLHRRRTSAYGENSEQWQQDHSAGVYAPAYAFMSPNGESSRRRTVDANGRERERDERCNVM